MSTYYTLLTDVGLAKLMNAVALDQDVDWTEMAVGDGNGNPTTPTQTQTTLVRERYRAPINQLYIDDANPNYLYVELVVPSTVGGWTAHEIGVYDSDGDLVAVSNYPATYKPVLAEGSGKDLVIRVIIEASNADSVTLKIDPAIVLASRSWVDATFLKRVKVGGGLTGQVLRKKSNAAEDFEWFTPGVSNITVNVVQELQTLAADQVIVDWATIGTNGAAFYIGGARLEPTDYTATSATQITLARAYPAGTKIMGAQNEPHDNLMPVQVLGGGGAVPVGQGDIWVASNGSYTLPDVTPLTNGTKLRISWAFGVTPSFTRFASPTLLRLPDGTTDTVLEGDIVDSIELILNKTANIWEIR